MARETACGLSKWTAKFSFMEEWKSYRIKDICTVNAAQYSIKEGWKTVMYLDTGSITENHIDDIQLFSLPYDELPSRARRKVKHNDIVFSTVRPNQKHFGILKHPADNLLVSTGFTVISAKPGIADPDYVYYYLTQSELIDYLQSVAEQSVSAYPSLKSSDIEEIEIALPSIAEQKRISSVLRSLDSKKELNNRINHNLEEQARALFKSWFVDFEPFKDGKFVDSELGMIPEGWRVLPLRQIAEYRKKSINPQRFPDTYFLHFSLPAFDNAKEPEIQCGAEIMSNKFVVEDKMVLFSKLNPRIKRLWVLDNVPDNSVCSTEFIAYKALNHALFSYIWCYLNGDSFYDGILSMVNGATGSHQRFHAEDTLGLFLPFNQDVAISFSNLISPILYSIMKNERENRLLKQERDALLPRLMNGTLHFGD